MTKMSDDQVQKLTGGDPEQTALLQALIRAEGKLRSTRTKT